VWLLDSRADGDENVPMRASLLLVLALACACGKKHADDAPCGTVASRLFMIAKDDLAKATVDSATRRAVADQLPAMRDALTQVCTDGAWTTQVRNCMANAADHAAFQACQTQMTDDQRRGLDRAARGETSSR
jgi:hypothetical protein